MSKVCVATRTALQLEIAIFCPDTTQRVLNTHTPYQYFGWLCHVEASSYIHRPSGYAQSKKISFPIGYLNTTVFQGRYFGLVLAPVFCYAEGSPLSHYQPLSKSICPNMQPSCLEVHLEQDSLLCLNTLLSSHGRWMYEDAST